MSTEQSVIGGRETFGEPKKIGQVTVDVDGDAVLGHHEPHGGHLRRVHRARPPVTSRSPQPETRTDFYFKALPAPDGKGLDTDPALVYCTREETVRWVKACAGELVLRDSRFDPVADLPVRSPGRGDPGRAQRRPAGPHPLDGAGRVGRALHAPALRRPLPDGRGLDGAVPVASAPGPTGCQTHGAGRPGEDHGLRRKGGRGDRRGGRASAGASCTPCSPGGPGWWWPTSRRARSTHRRRGALAPSGPCAACAPTCPIPARWWPWPTTSTPPRAGATSSSPTPASPRAAAGCPGSRRSTTGAGASRSTSSAWPPTVLTFLPRMLEAGTAGRHHRHLLG